MSSRSFRHMSITVSCSFLTFCWILYTVISILLRIATMLLQYYWEKPPCYFNITENSHHATSILKWMGHFLRSLNALQCSEKCVCRFFSSEVNTPTSADLELMLCVLCDLASFHALYFIASNIIITQILLLKHKQINNILF